MRKLALALIPSLVLACDRGPAAPAAVSAPAFAASSDWTRSSFFFDFPGVLVPCRRETMHFYGEVPYTSHQVSSASGVYNYHFQLSPQTPNNPPYYAVGETSGKVYLYKNGGPLNESFHLAAGEVHTYLDRETYVAENGDRLVTDLTFHVTTNANGQLTADKSDASGFQCIDRH